MSRYILQVQLRLHLGSGASGSLIDATQALECSSNAYMVKIALGLLGQTYSPNMYLNDGETLTNAMTKLR